MIIVLRFILFSIFLNIFIFGFLFTLIELNLKQIFYYFLLNILYINLKQKIILTIRISLFFYQILFVGIFNVNNFSSF